MTRRLSPRRRQTLLGLGAGRAAGFYEQCDHRQPNDATIDASYSAQAGSLVASGLVLRPRRLTASVLRSMAGSDRLSDFDARSVSIADLLSEIRLDADADVIMWHGLDGSRVATPVARLFDDVGAELLLGGPDLCARPVWSAPVILRSANLPGSDEMGVVSMTAITFAQFVGGEL